MSTPIQNASQCRALICGLQSSENIWWQSCRCPTRFYRDFKPPLLFLTVTDCCSACKRKHLLFLRRLKLCCQTHTCARSLGKTRGLGKTNWAIPVQAPSVFEKGFGALLVLCVIRFFGVPFPYRASCYCWLSQISAAANLFFLRQLTLHFENCSLARG